MAAAQPDPGWFDEPEAPEAREARDAVAFGREIGRVLSDGTIVGRPEPYAKVFPSSRAVKRQVGVTAWAILEDIALDARIDDAGRLVAETNVRRIADNLGMSKNTVSKHLGTLREHGFTIREEAREDGGEWGGSRYVLDPSACLERFTTTPRGGPDGHPDDAGAERSDEEAAEDQIGDSRPSGGGFGPRTSSWDTVEATVSQSMGHRDLGHNKDNAVAGENQQRQCIGGWADGRLLDRLTAAGVDEGYAEHLVEEHPAGQIVDALVVIDHRDADNPAGWLVAAIRDRWDLSEEVAELRADEVRAERIEAEAADRREQRQRDEEALDRTGAWREAVSAAIDDVQLRAAVARITDRLPQITAGSVPVVRAELIRLAVAAHERHPHRPLRNAVGELLAEGVEVGRELPSPLPEPPPVQGEGREVRPLGERIAVVLAESDDDKPVPVPELTREETR